MISHSADCNQQLHRGGVWNVSAFFVSESASDGHADRANRQTQGYSSLMFSAIFWISLYNTCLTKLQVHSRISPPVVTEYTTHSLYEFLRRIKAEWLVLSVWKRCFQKEHVWQNASRLNKHYCVYIIIYISLAWKQERKGGFARSLWDRCWRVQNI